MLPKKISYWNKALKDLKQKDKILAKIISSHNKDYLIISNNYFISLIRAIIGQQISVKAAQSIWNKFYKKYNLITPKNSSSLSIFLQIYLYYFIIKFFIIINFDSFN